MRKKRMMMIALLCAVVQGIWADSFDITYIERAWDADKKEVKEIEHTTSNYISMPASAEWINLEGGKNYYFSGYCTYKALEITGEDVHIILGDKCKVNLKHIKLEEGKSLHIHTLKGKSGKMIVENDEYEGAAGIGGGKNATSGSLYIHDGDITAIGNESGAGIGGGDSGSCGDVVIYGGIVVAESGVGGAGIGGGEDRGINLTNSVTIYGGDIKATATSFDPYYDSYSVNKYGAGIGGGDEGQQGGPVYIYGGKVVANTERGHGAGIGGGDKCDGGTVVISGGNVRALAGYSTTAIGAGKGGNGGNITITGGEVEAVSGIPYQYGVESYSVGMGTFDGEKGTVTITGGYVKVGGKSDPSINANVTLGYVRVTDGNKNVECKDRLSYIGDNTNGMNIFKCEEHEYVDFVCKWCGWFDSEGLLNSWEGEGTAEHPYLIQTDADWRAIHSYLMNNKSFDTPDAKPYEGIHFLQTADISTSQGIGVTGWSNDRAFCGIYDGGGHQLNCNIANPKDNGGEAVAPFHLVKGATIKNLYVSGKVNGGIHSAGLVAYTNGTVTIDSCRVSAEITCTGSTYNDAHGGGIVGHAQESNITVSKSIFDGTLTATANGNGNGDIRLGAIVGWSNPSCTERIEYCFENGKYNGFTSNDQTAFCRKYDSTTTPDNAVGNIYTSDLGHGDGAQKVLSVTSGQKKVQLIIGDTQGYDWEEMYFGAFSKAKGKEAYLFNDTFYTFENCEVKFNLDYPGSWNYIDVYANGTLLNAFTGFYSFTQGSEPTVITTMVALEISDTTPNDQMIESYDGATANVTYTGRKFYKNDGWYTICLPFDLPTNLVMFDGAEVCTLESSEYDSSENKLTLNFTDKPDTISAGTPYLVRWQDDEREEVQLNFDGVIIKNKHQAITTDYANFVGSFSPVSLNAGDRSILYLGAEDKLYYPTGNITMGSCRAYFKLVGITAGDLETGTANAVVLNFGDDTTGITTLSTEPGKEATSTTGWHTLDGRRLSGKPDKGIYIHNGKKVVVK